MQNVKGLKVEELQKVNGGMTFGKCMSYIGAGVATGAGYGAISGLGVGSIGGAFVGAHVGMVAGSLNCLK